MKFSLVMRTVPRSTSYVEQTLARLQEVGAPAPFISANAEVSPNENACLALEGADPSAEWVIFLEDDIDVIDDFMGSVGRWLDDHHSPTIHYYPLACQYSQCFIPGQTAWPYRVEGYYGSQGLVLRRSQVESLVAYVRTQTVGRGFDLALARWHRIVEPTQDFLLTPVPCLIDHIGQVSSMGCDVGRFAGFKGRDYVYGR